MSSARSRAQNSSAVQDWRSYGKNARRLSRNSASAGLLAAALLAAFIPLHPQTRISLPPLERRILITMESAAPPPTAEAIGPDEPQKLVTEESEYRIEEELRPPEPHAEKIPEVAPPKAPVTESAEEKAPVREAAPKPPRKTETKAKQPKKSPPKAAPSRSASKLPDSDPVPGRQAAASTPPAPAVAGTAIPDADRGKVAAAVLQAVERYKKYPKAARRSGAEGRLMITVKVGVDGRIASCNVSTPSGKAALDAAGSLLAEKLIGVSVGGSSPVTVTVPVVYRLSDS